MRILHIGKYFYPYYYGGMEKHLFNLCEELSSTVDVEVLVANVGRQSLSLRMNGMKVHKTGKWFEVASTPITPTMIGQLNGRPYDIVHLHLPNPMGTLAYYLKRPRGRLVVTWHSDIIKQKRLVHLYRPLQTWILDHADRIIVSSDNYLQSSVPLRSYRDKCEIIPLGIDIPQFQMTDKIRDEVAYLRGKYRNIVYFVGRLVPYKGLEHLIRAMLWVDGVLMIASNGPLFNKLKKLTAELGLENRVLFLGELDFPKLLTYYHACDVFCLPSVDRSEAFGIVQLEAMACGKPVVSTALDTGVTLVNRDGETGTVVPPRDERALADALNGLLEDPERAAALGAYARERVCSEFGTEHVTARTLALYEQVMQETR